MKKILIIMLLMTFLISGASAAFYTNNWYGGEHFYVESNQDTNTGLVPYFAQTFTIGTYGGSGNILVESLGLYLKKVGSISTITIEIRDVNATGGPDNVLSSASLSPADVTTDFSWVEVDIPDYTLTDGTQYAITLRETGSGSIYLISRESSGADFKGGLLWYSNDGISWNNDSDADMPFILNGDKDLGTTGNITFYGEENRSSLLKVPTGSFLTVASFGIQGLQNVTYPSDVFLEIGYGDGNYEFDWEGSSNTTTYYSFSETSGTNLPDRTSTSNDGTTQNMEDADWVTGKIDNSLLFDGSNEWVSINNPLEAIGTDDWSINVWFNDTETGANNRDILTLGTTDHYLKLFINNVAFTDALVLTIVDTNTGTSITLNAGNNIVQPNTWSMATITKTGTNVTLYLNNTQIASSNAINGFGSNFGSDGYIAKEYGAFPNYWKGYIDEMGFWNDSFTSSDVNDLWNSGNGVGYSAGEFSNSTVVNNIAYKINDYLDNCLIEIGSYCYVPFNFHSLTQGSLYYSIINFSNNGILENKQVFHNESFEFAQETFSINITYDSSAWSSITATLNYDGTDYTGATKTIQGDTYEFNKTISIADVTGSENRTFYWNFRLTNATGSYYFNSSFNNQTVSDLGIDNCSTYTNLLINYTLKDEDTQTNIVGDIEIDLQITDLDKSSSIDFNQTFSNVTYATICINNQLQNGNNIYVNSKAKYSANNHQPEQNNIRSYLLNSSSTGLNVSLLDLNTSRATVFDIKYKNSAFLPVANAVIDITREYVGEGTFKTVESPITDASGQATASLIKDEQVYTIYVSKDGELLSVFSNVYAICQNELIDQCEINLNALSSVETPTNFKDEGNLRYTLNWNPVTREVSTSFTTVDGTSHTINLTTYVFDAYINQSLCSDEVTSSSGTLTCMVPASYVNQTVIVYLYYDGDLIENPIISLMPNPSDIFGNTGILIVLILIIIIPLMFITSLVGMVIGVILGFALAGLLVLQNGAGTASLAVSFAWLLVAAGVIIWKLNNSKKGAF